MPRVVIPVPPDPMGSAVPERVMFTEGVVVGFVTFTARKAGTVEATLVTLPPLGFVK